MTRQEWLIAALKSAPPLIANQKTAIAEALPPVECDSAGNSVRPKKDRQESTVDVHSCGQQQPLAKAAKQ